MTPPIDVAASLARVRVVLVSTTNSGNIGATARAMRVMGLSDLVLVDPVDHLCLEAVARSAGNAELLRSATVVDTLAEAVADCSLVLGASRRARFVGPLTFTARQAGVHAAQTPLDQRIAVVFGQERAGLTNEQLARCGARLAIPTAEDYGSLNLAAAVQIACYELRMGHLSGDDATPAPVTPSAPGPPAPRAELEGFFTHLHEALVTVGFTDPTSAAHALSFERIRQLYQRAGLTQEEIHLLRGIQSRTLVAAAKSGD